MALEVPAYVPDLVAANPPNSDQRKQGDDHLRAIKTATRQSLELLGPVFTTGGTSTALTVTTSHVNTPSYKNGHIYTFILGTTIGADATINYDGLGTRTLKKHNGTSWVNVAAGDYVSGQMLICSQISADSTMRILGVSKDPVGRSGDTTSGALHFTYTNDGTVGTPINYYVNSATPAASDVLIYIQFMGNDSGGNATVYGHLVPVIADPTNGSEDGEVYLAVNVAGTVTERLRARASGVFVQPKLEVSDGTQQVTIEGGDGGINITRTAGAAYIDFKNAIGDDFDVRVRQLDSTLALAINIAGTGDTATIDADGVHSKTNAKAWLHGDFTAGTPSNVAGYNVASFVDHGAGDVTVTWTTPMSQDAYAIVVTTAFTAAMHVAGIAAQSSFGVQLKLTNLAGVLTDANYRLVAFAPGV